MNAICVSFSGDYWLSMDEVWPDGDAPAEVTAETVARVMQACGRKLDVLRQWDVAEGLQVRVSVADSEAEVWT